MDDIRVYVKHEIHIKFNAFRYIVQREEHHAKFGNLQKM